MEPRRSFVSALAFAAVALAADRAPSGPVDVGARLPNPVIFVGQPPIPTGWDSSVRFSNLLGFGAPYRTTMGANLFRLDPDGAVTNLTKRANAAVRNPEISFDGARVLYAMALGAAGKWQVFELNVDGTGHRKISRDASFNDMDPAYLPDGRIVFTSDRRRFLDPYTNLPSAQLHVMDADGSRVTELSTDPGGDFAPATLANGEVGFVRWNAKIADRSQPSDLDVSRFLFWKMNPDGTNDGHPAFGPHSAAAAFGGYVQTREIPDGTGRLVATVTRDIYYTGAGALVRIDPSGNQDAHHPHWLTQPAGANGAFAGDAWRDPFPLADGRLLASFTAGPDESPFGPTIDTAGGLSFALVVTDSEGDGRRVLYDDPDLWEWEPVEVAARPVPPVIASTLDRSVPWGVLNSRDVAVRGHNPFVALPDVQPGVAGTDGLKVRIFRGVRRPAQWGYTPGYGWLAEVRLGDVPVEADGSFAARVPSGVPLTWEIVDASGQTLVKERVWSQVLPGQTQTCNGCHSPHDGRAGRMTNLALARPVDLVDPTSLRAVAATAVAAARTSVAEVRTLFDDATAAGLVAPGLANRVARAEANVARARAAMEASDFGRALFLARGVTPDTRFVRRKLSPAK